MNTSIAFIGGGNMATSLIAGLLKDRLKPEQILVAEPDADRRTQLENEYAIKTTQNNSDCLQYSTVVLAVKPQIMQQVCRQLASSTRSADCLFISIAAGINSDDIDRWVRSQLAGPEEWMLRQAAVDSITARGHRGDARSALADSYPRVRAHAAAALSGDPDTLVERATLARRDTWPMVRAEAVTSLRTEGDGLPVIVASVDDSMSLVRAAAIDVLTEASHDEGWARIHKRLSARNEWPRVTKAANGYVVAHCRTDAIQALLGIIMRAAPGNALTDDLNNAALAIEALRALGTPEADAAVEQLRGTAGVPPTLKMALEQPLPEDSGCAPTGR